MAYSVQQFTSTGTEDHVILSFPYLDKADIHLYGNSVETAFVWVSANRIDFPPFPAGTEVVVRRLTNRDKVRYLLQEGAPFTREILDQIHTQALYLAQEAAEGVFFDMYGDINMHGFRVRNAGAPQIPSDYTTKQWVESAIQDINSDYGLRAVFTGPDNKGLDNFFGGGGWLGSDASTGNIYNSPYDTNGNALRWRYDIPETDNRLPIAYLKKTIKTTRDTSQGGQPSRWDEGTLYSHITKTGGTAYAAGITSMFDAVGGSGDSVSIHARANGRVPHVIGGQEGSGVWGLWSFTIATPSDGTFIKQALGQEINLVNNGMPMPFPTPVGQGNYIGSFITALNNICSHGVEIGGGLGGSWNRGLFIRQGAITPSETYAGTTAIELEGGTFGKRHGGIKFGKGYLDYGINFAKPSEDYANFAAIILGDGNRIYMGDSASAANYITKVVGQPQVNFQNLTLAINGTKVVGARQTGIFQMAGTADGASIPTDTCTLQQLARYVKKMSDAMIVHGLVGPT